MVMIRKAQIGDSKDLFSWRNDETTRIASLNSSEISWDDHVKWYSVALHNPRIVLYIAEDNSLGLASLGMCRFNIAEAQDKAEVSINLNPVFRGKGLAQHILHESIKSFSLEKQSIGLLEAIIKSDNHPSMKIFLAEGFTPQLTQDGVVHLELQLKA